jgi:alpha/beta superfamily hydrolase
MFYLLAGKLQRSKKTQSSGYPLENQYCQPNHFFCEKHERVGTRIARFLMVQYNYQYEEKHTE